MSTLSRFLCTPECKPKIKELGRLLDCCEGLTLGVEFTR